MTTGVFVHFVYDFPYFRTRSFVNIICTWTRQSTLNIILSKSKYRYVRQKLIIDQRY